MRIEEVLVVPDAVTLPTQTRDSIEEFLRSFPTAETESQISLLLHVDGKNGAMYIAGHIEAKMLASCADLDAVLDPSESEEYKLNREVYTDTYAYEVMARDALLGRPFEDVVTEYDTSYRPKTPLKVFGGQHRMWAIIDALAKGVSVAHGVRVYFCLTVDQRFDIAIANNTSIAVPNDLLDRMQEELLGSELRDWCHTVGLLPAGQNYADRRNAAGIPTVRIARTLVANYQIAIGGPGKDRVPSVCRSGPGVDPIYERARESIDWEDPQMIDMGSAFARLHWAQREIVLNRKGNSYVEFANKAIHPSVTASWAFAAGSFQETPNHLEKHYALASFATPPKDPLNAFALSRARMKGTDPDTYRGLGSRISGDEIGRMLEVFLLHAQRAKSVGISDKLPNGAIQSYEAKKASQRAEQALRGI